MKRLQNLLETKYASAACIIFAIANRIIFTTLYSSIGRDTKVQLNYTQNLLSGNGMGLTKYFTTNLDHAVFDTYQLFPPGFSFTIIPFLKLFGGDEYKAILVFDILAAILFVISVRNIGKNIGLSNWMNNLLTLIAGCIQYPFFMSYSSTDVISLSLVLFSFSAIIEVVDKKKDLSFIQVLLYGSLFFLPSFFKYMYLPVTVLLPLLIILYALLIKNKQLRKTGIKLFASTAFFLILLFTLTAFNSGNAIHVYNDGRGIFVDQIIHWYPFLPASFINLDFASQQVARISGINYSQSIQIFEIINALLFLLLAILLIRYLILNKKKSSLDARYIFITSGSIISIAIILMLAYLSLTYKAQDWGNYKWTYNQDVRYFAFVYVFVLLLFFVLINHYPTLFKKNLMKIISFLIATLLIIEFLHGVYYNAKIILQHKDLTYIKEADKNYRAFPSFLTELKRQNPEREIYICSPDQFYMLTASQIGCRGIFDYANLNTADIQVSVESLLVLAVHENDTWIMKEYIEKHKPKLLSIISGTSFYSEEINLQ